MRSPAEIPASPQCEEKAWKSCITATASSYRNTCHTPDAGSRQTGAAWRIVRNHCSYCSVGVVLGAGCWLLLFGIDMSAIDVSFFTLRASQAVAASTTIQAGDSPESSSV